MLSRWRIEPMPTENQFVSGVKNIKNPTTSTPRPRYGTSDQEGNALWKLAILRHIRYV